MNEHRYRFWQHPSGAWVAMGDRAGDPVVEADTLPNALRLLADEIEARARRDEVTRS